MSKTQQTDKSYGRASTSEKIDSKTSDSDDFHSKGAKKFLYT